MLPVEKDHLELFLKACSFVWKVWNAFLGISFEFGIMTSPSVDTMILPRAVMCIPHNKPWITSDLKESLNTKKKAFREGVRPNNVRAVWSGM